ncbi:DoxX family protein [Protaetiibacter mangrovi]|uniref:DoxX family protein n=1 Tax=Protaetiibacter mangrovi TaxID=2970926 RepID=A0ABT1ZCW4_9MICO|nr:DoxX family protein [Protaetiibacter mangrovi]MCS0498526.1 DoxX family protein [Protaetiibacter mangrovi]
MIIAYWIVAGLTALAFLAAGGLKLARSTEQLAASGLAWTEDFPAWAVKLIGAAEVLGAVGLVLPMATGVAPILGPVAAIALAVLMLGAAIVHLRRHEPPIPFALVALATASAVLGFLAIG